jgi:hypothetical protein
MARHGSRRGERVQSEKPVPAAEAGIRPPASPAPESGPVPPQAPGLHWTWKAATLVFAGAFLILLLYDWLGALYRLTQ